MTQGNNKTWAIFPYIYLNAIEIYFKKLNKKAINCFPHSSQKSSQ